MNSRRAQYLTETGRIEEARAERRRPQPLKFPLRVEQIFTACAQEHRISITEMIEHSDARAMRAKRAAARRLREAGFSLFEIGRHLRRHHSTILYLLRTERPPRKPVRADWGRIEIPLIDLSGEWAV